MKANRAMRILLVWRLALLLVFLQLPVIRAASCAWQRTRNQNCGWSPDGSCITNSDQIAHDIGISPDNVESCLDKCAVTADCVAVNYAKPGNGGSGGPRTTSTDGTGCCFYRSATSCGLKCQAGRDCWRRSDEFNCSSSAEMDPEFVECQQSSEGTISTTRNNEKLVSLFV